MTISEHTKFHRQFSETKKYTCDYCGKEFDGKNATRGTHRFCSKECNSKWAYRNKTETRICAECGKEFTTNKYRKTKYCSKECVAKVNSRVHRKKISNKPISRRLLPLGRLFSFPFRQCKHFCRFSAPFKVNSIKKDVHLLYTVSYLGFCR